MSRAGKLLAGGALALLVLMILLWHQLDASTASPVPAPRSLPAAAPAAAPPPIAAAVAPPASQPAEPVAAEDKPAVKKIDVQSDAFFYGFQEVVPKKLSVQAATCYEGIATHVHRNQKLSLNFHIRIKNGDVTIEDVKIKENTLNNPSLENCFISKVAHVTWHDDTLPDWDSDDELVIRPERGLKGYMKSNMDYVGEPAPRD